MAVKYLLLMTFLVAGFFFHFKRVYGEKRLGGGGGGGRGLVGRC